MRAGVLLVAGVASVVLLVALLLSRARPDAVPAVSFEGVSAVPAVGVAPVLFDDPAPAAGVAERTRRRAGDAQRGARAPAGRAAIDLCVVRDEDGTPIAGARVHLAGRRDDARTTDAEGRARIEGLAAPGASVTASADGRASRSLRVPIEGEATTVAELRLVRERTVLVRVVSANGSEVLPGELGLSPSHVEALEIDLAPLCAPPGHARPARTSARANVVSRPKQGDALAWRLRIEGLDVHWVHLVLGNAVLAAERLDPGVVDLVVPLGRASIERVREPVLVRVVDGPDGAPVVGAEVRLGFRMGGFALRRTDAEGRARFDERTYSADRLTIRCEAFATRHHDVAWPRAGEIEIALSVARRVHGAVRDERGDPVPRARIEVRALAPDGVRFEREPRFTANANRDGYFLIDGLEGGRYLLTLAGDEVRGSVTIDGPHAADEVVIDCTERDVAAVELRRVVRPARVRPVDHAVR